MLIAFIIACLISILLYLLQIFHTYKFFHKDQLLTGKIPYISVILPVFNEKQDVFDKCVQSILSQTDVHIEIVVVNDGSDNHINILQDDRITYIRLPLNRGKRFAQFEGIRQSKYDLVATIDSDTILETNSLANLYAAKRYQSVSAITGAVFAGNRNQNWVTRLTGCIYGLSIFQHRAEQSFYQTVICCSGAMSLYDKKIFIENTEEYIDQKLFGQICMAGDDRHITSLCLLNGHKVGWTSLSRCYTEIPVKLLHFIRQQVRWIRSNVTELLFLFPRLFQMSMPFKLFTLKLVFNYAFRIFSFVAMIYFCCFKLSIVPIILAIILLFGDSFIKMTLDRFILGQRFGGYHNSLYVFLFGWFEFFVMTPVIVYAICTPFYGKWLTRQSKKVSETT